MYKYNYFLTKRLVCESNIPSEQNILNLPSLKY